MERNIFKQGYEQAAVEFNRFTNSVIGLLAFTLGMSSFAFNDAATSFASWSFTFLFVYTAYEHKMRGNVLKRHYQGYSHTKYFFYILKNNLIYVTGLTFLFLVAIGLIDVEHMQLYSFAKFGQ